MSDLATRALPLVDSIYAAAVDRAGWGRFASELSEALGGAAIAMAIQLPGPGRAPSYYGAGLRPRGGKVFGRHYARGLPWGSFAQPVFRGRFCRGGEIFKDSEVAGTDFYREWMKPQGLAPEGPLAHTIDAEGPRATVALAAFRRVGGRPFTDDDRALADLLVPHLACAVRLHRRAVTVEERRTALAQVIDRLPTAVLVLDRGGRPVYRNASAERYAELEDGFAIDEHGPRAELPHENAALRRMLTQAVAEGSSTGRGAPGVMTVSRPSGRPAFAAAAAPLHAPPQPARSDDPVAVLFLADAEAGQPTTDEALHTLYGMSHAEAFLARRLAAGHSIEEVAAERGVTLHTVRSQLKSAFAKTGTHRQSELVRLVLRIGSVDVGSTEVER